MMRSISKVSLVFSSIEAALIMSPYSFCIVLVLVWVSLATVYTAKPASSYFPVCRKSTADLAGCIKSSLTSAAATFVKGIPELGLAKLDPLYVANIEIKDTVGGIKFQQTLSNLNIYGMSSFTIQSVKVDANKHTLQLTLNSPSIQLAGKYSMDVQISTLPVKGSGDCKMSFKNVAQTVNIEAEKFTSGGKSYLRVKTLDWSVNPTTGEFSFSSIGDVANKFINSNWKLAYGIYKQVPERAFSDLLKGIINNVLAKFPVDELYPN